MYDGSRGWNVTRIEHYRAGTLDEPFLPPIEEPRGLIFRLMYALMWRQFGKVFTPLKMHSARLPLAFLKFYGKISQLDKKLILAAETAMLIRQQVARINVCEFCIDIGRWAAIKASVSEAKFDALDQYRTSSLFNEKERAALDYVTELTRDKKADRETFVRLSSHYTEREVCAIVWLAASEHVYNMTNIGLNSHSDVLCDISRMKGTRR